jgi:hypothetical protein
MPVLGLVLAVLFVARAGRAAPKDAAALRLDHEAIYNDYLATKFGDAERKLKQALAMCQGAACSAKVRAQLHRDLGIVYVVGLKRDEDAKREFAEAFKSDPGIALIKDLTTPEIERAFAAARSGAGGGGDSGGDTAAEAPEPAASGGGDIAHRGPPEQLVQTPVPIYARLAEGVTASKVQVRYKPFGAEWKTIEMKKMKAGYGIEIPCVDVGATGDFKYYIQALDAEGSAVATSGTRSAPHVVAIKNEISGDPPHLPARPPPAQCASSADCPPDLPGCPSGKKGKKHGDKGWGASCDASSDCQEGLMCKEGSCQNDEGGGKSLGASCKTAEDCESGQTCVEGVCQTPVPAKKNWISLSVQQDTMLLPSAQQVCTTMETYTCFFSTNELYDGVPIDDANTVAGGLALATTRILLGFDRRLTDNVTAGVRLGYAFRGGPQKPATAVSDEGKPFFPFHLELRGAYWLGTRPFEDKGLRPYVVAAAGIAQVDASVVVTVYEAGQADALKLAAWRKTGQMFVAAGVGAVYATSPKSGFLLELKLQEMIGTSATGIMVSGGYTIGL